MVSASRDDLFLMTRHLFRYIYVEAVPASRSSCITDDEREGLKLNQPLRDELLSIKEEVHYVPQ